MLVPYLTLLAVMGISGMIYGLAQEQRLAPWKVPPPAGVDLRWTVDEQRGMRVFTATAPVGELPWSLVCPRVVGEADRVATGDEGFDRLTTVRGAADAAMGDLDPALRGLLTSLCGVSAVVIDRGTIVVKGTHREWSADLGAQIADVAARLRDRPGTPEGRMEERALHDTHATVRLNAIRAHIARYQNLPFADRAVDALPGSRLTLRVELARLAGDRPGLLAVVTDRFAALPQRIAAWDLLAPQHLDAVARSAAAVVRDELAPPLLERIAALSPAGVPEEVALAARAVVDRHLGAGSVANGAVVRVLLEAKQPDDLRRLILSGAALGKEDALRLLARVGVDGPLLLVGPLRGWARSAGERAVSVAATRAADALEARAGEGSAGQLSVADPASEVGAVSRPREAGSLGSAQDG
jgi:hypothetical protein